MAKPKLHGIATIPGAASLEPILKEFARKGHGIVTSLADERLRLAGTLQPEDSTLETVAFGEVVGRFLIQCGEHVRPLPRAGLAEAALAEVHEVVLADGPFAPAGRHPGTHKLLKQAIGELKAYGIDGLKMQELAETASPDLAAKLRSLRAVDQSIYESLEQLGFAGLDVRIRDSLRCKPDAKPRLGRVLVLAGSEATPAQLDWIRWAASAGADVTVVVDACSHGSEALFAGARRILAALDIEPERQGSGNELADRIFAPGEPEGPPSPIPLEVSTMSAADPLAEVEWALRGCLADQVNGIRLSECALVVRHLAPYAPLIEAASKRLGIPVRMARRVPLRSNAMVRLVVDTLSCCGSDDVRALGAILPSTYIGLDLTLRKEVESAIAEAYRARSRQWASLEEWARERAEQIPWLAKLLEWRTAVVRQAAPLGAWLERLRSMVEGVDWIGACADGPPSTRDRDLRAMSALQRAIAQQASIAGLGSNRPLDLGQFARFCRKLVESADSSIPEGQAGVQIASSADQLGTVDSLYVLGMLEGVFPRRRREDPILTDDDRRELSALLPGQTPLPTSHDKAREERDEFYRVCAAPRKRLMLSYPLASEESDNVPAFYLEEVRRVLDRPITHIAHPRAQVCPPLEDCVSDSDRRLAASFSSVRTDPLPNRLATEIAAERIRLPKDAPVPIGAIRLALECPFHWLSRRRLKVLPRARVGRWQALQFLPEKAGLALAESREAAAEALQQALRAELEEGYGIVPPSELALIELGGQRLIEEWVESEFRSRELWPKDPGSVQTHRRFGDPSIKSDFAFNTSGVQSKIEGEIGSIATMGKTRVAMIPRPKPRFADLTRLDKLELGLIILGLLEKGHPCAVEAPSLQGGRFLFMIRKPEGGGPPSAAGFLVSSLDEKEMFGEVVAMLKDARDRMHEPATEPSPGDPCQFCDFGELCRRHRDYSDEVSPFDREGTAFGD